MKRFCTGALLLAGALWAAATASAGETGAFDPVWGQYATLAGTRAQAGTDGYALRWYWAVPGRELVQEYIDPGRDGRVAHRDVIKPGAQPGSLVLTSSALGRKQWHGTVQPDGRVLFIGKGLLKLPYLAGRAEDGAWELTPVDIEDGRVVAEKPASEYARFMPVVEAGATAAAAPMTSAAPVAAAAPASAAPTSASAMALAMAMAPAPAPPASAPSSAEAPPVAPDTPEVALLRSLIEGLRSGSLPHDRMAPGLVEALRPKLPELRAYWAAASDIRSIDAGWPMGPYRFLVHHGDRPVEWRMDLSGDGRATSLYYRPVTPEYVTAVRSFGRFATLAGKRFVHHNTKASFQLEEGGQVLVMHGSWGTVRLRRDAAGGLHVTPAPGHNTSRAVATMEADGTLALELSYRGGLTRQTGTRRHRITVSRDGSGFNEVQHWRNGGITLVGRSYAWQADKRYVPLNDRNLAEQTRNAAHARAEARRRDAEEQAARDAAFAGFMGGLQQAADQYQQQQAQTRQFNAEIAAITREAEQRQRREQEAQRRARAAQQQVAGAQGAAAVSSQPPAPATPAPGVGERSAAAGSTTRSPATGDTRTAAAAAPKPSSAPTSSGGAPMRFVLKISMTNLPGDRVNPTCYSNVVTRPGPPGWGERGFLPSGSGEQARATVESLKSQFFAACRRSGRDITHEGNFTWVWNRSPDDATRVSSTRARYSEDVSVTIN